MYLIKTPAFLKKIYPEDLVWNKSRTEKSIFLTFDDGPIPIVTPWVLKTLKNFHAKATFFCIGDNIVKHPEVFAQLKQEGHSVGNHTFNHLNGWRTDDDVYLSNYEKCQKLVPTNLFRPPYGRIKFSQVKKILKTPQLGKEHAVHDDKPLIIMWDVLSGDFDTKLAPEKCLKNVLKYTENGSVIVFHDSLKAWDRLAYVLPKALEHWSKEGFSFKAL